MLEKVSQSALVLLLLNRTHLLCNIEIAALFGPFVMTNVISKAVRQSTRLYSRVKGNIGHLLCMNTHHCCKQSNDNNKEFLFHIITIKCL